MKTLYWMLIIMLIPIFLFSLLFFVLVLELLDLFANLWRYLAHEADVATIARIALLYLPKCISFSVPAAALFSIAFTLGNLYKNNELIAIFGSGIGLATLVVPFALVGILLSVGGFVFENNVVIDTLEKKNILYRTAVHQTVTFSNANVTVMSSDSRTLYQANYYNDQKETLTQVMIVVRDEAGEFQTRVDADWAEWNGANWIMHNSTLYEQQGAGLRSRYIPLYDVLEFSEPPATFRKITRDVDEMKAQTARDWVFRLKRAGLPYREALTSYYKKYFFAFSPFIVTLIASGVGGRFKRNILLMNLLMALVISVLYYITQMISLIMAKNGTIPPLLGASGSFILFFFAGLFLIRTART